jgi:hypothetical protein
MPYRYEPTEEASAQVRNDLDELKHNPAAYWQEIADSLLNATLEIEQAHRAECTADECNTCLLIARMRLVLDAHDTLQPSGCSCDDHRTYPRPPDVEASNRDYTHSRVTPTGRRRLHRTDP